MIIENAVNEALAELQRARQKWPAGFHSGHEGYAVLKEELEELWEAVRRDDIPAQRSEAVQIAAMALRFLTDVG